MWSVIVVAKGMWPVTEVFLNTLTETAGEKLDLVYIDNGSPDSTAWGGVTEWSLRRSLPVKLIRFDDGVPLAKAWNEGYRSTSGEKILICNNDLIFKKHGWLQKFDEALQDKEVGVVGMTGMSWRDTPFIQGSIFGFRDLEYAAYYHGEPLREGDDVVGFDERFLFTCEEVDWCKRLQLLSKKIMPLEYLKGEYIEHAEGATRNFYKDQIVEMQRQAHISRLEFCYKWCYPEISIHD